jgi:hypothetical protein
LLISKKKKLKLAISISPKFSSNPIEGFPKIVNQTVIVNIGNKINIKSLKKKNSMFYINFSI